MIYVFPRCSGSAGILFLLLSFLLSSSAVIIVHAQDQPQSQVLETADFTSLREQGLVSREWDEVAEDQQDPHLERRMEELCGVHMRGDRFLKECNKQKYYYDWDGVKPTVDEVEQPGNKRPRPHLQCDHIVEIQWLHSQIQNNDLAREKCNNMKDLGTEHPDHTKFRDAFAGRDNAVYIPGKVNGLKGLYNNRRTTAKALANKEPNFSLATGDYVAKTKGRAMKVLDNVYEVLPSLKEGPHEGKELTVVEKEGQAKEAARHAFETATGMKRTFKARIAVHTDQVIADCKTSAANCPEGGPKPKPKKKRPTTPSKALPESPLNKAKVDSASSQASSSTHAGSKKPTSESSSKSESSHKKQPGASASKSASSSSRSVKQDSAKTKSRDANSKTQGSRCNPMKRSLCQYRPKAAATGGTHKNQRPTRSSWSAQRKAALSLPGLRKGPGAPRKTTSWQSKTRAEGRLWRSSPKLAHNTRPMRSSSRSKPVASSSRSRTASRSHSASSSRSPSHPTGSSPSPSRSSSTFRTQRSSAHGTKPMKSKLNSITIALRPSTKSSKGGKTPKLGSLPTSAKTGSSRAAKSGKVKGHKSH